MSHVIYRPTQYRGSLNRGAKYVAPRDRRYVGMFHYCGYWRGWDKIIAVSAQKWTVVAVDVDGNECGEIRTHMTEMDARCFADRPFEVN